MRKTVLTFGLIGGAILAAVMLAVTLPFHDQMGMDTGMIVGYTSMVAAFMTVYFGIRSYRDNVLGGSISFGRALKVGSLIALIASCCYVATWEVVYYTTQNDFLEKYQASELAQSKAAGMSASDLAAKEAEMAKFAALYKNPFVNAAMTFAEPLPVALVFTLVSAGLLSRRKRASQPMLAG